MEKLKEYIKKKEDSKIKDEESDEEEVIILDDPKIRIDISEKFNPFKNKLIDWHSKIIPNFSDKKNKKEDEIFYDEINANDDKIKDKKFDYLLSEKDLLKFDILINSFLYIVNSSVFLSNYSKFNEIEEDRICGKFLAKKNFNELLERRKINTYEYALLKVNFYYKNGYKYDSSNYNKNFPKEIDEYKKLGPDGKRRYMFTLLVNNINRVDKMINELVILGNKDKKKKDTLNHELNFFVNLRSKWETYNRIPYITDINIKNNIKKFRQLIKDNLYKKMDSCENNIYKMNPKFKIINYNTNKEPEYKIIVDINLVLDLFRYYYGPKLILIDKDYRELLEKMKFIYINSLGVLTIRTYENKYCLINIYNFIIRNDIYYGHNTVFDRFHKINKRYKEFTQRQKNFKICSIKEGAIYISSIYNDENSNNNNKIIKNDDNLNIPEYIYWKNSKKKGRYYLQKTDRFFILQPSYSYAMEEIKSLNISNIKSMYITDRQNELLYYKKNFIYKCDVHGLIDYCKKNKMKLNVKEEILLLDGFFIEYIPDELAQNLKFEYGEKEYFAILNNLYLEKDYNKKIYKEQNNIIDDIDSNEKSQINIINNKSLRRSSYLEGEANKSLYFDHENVCYINKYNIINKIFHDIKYIKNKYVDIPRDANYIDFIEEFNWQLELFSHIKLFGLRNPIFYVFLYKDFILDEKYRDELSDEMIEKYNNYLLYISNNYCGALTYLDMKDIDIIKEYIKKEMAIFERDCKIIDIILFGGIASNKNLTVPPNWFIWDKELEIIFGEYCLINPQLKEYNRKENLEIEPDADKLNEIKERLREPYAFFLICVRGGILQKYIILMSIDANKNKRAMLTKEKYAKKFKKFSEKKKLNIEINFLEEVRSNFLANNMYNFWYFIEPEKPKNCFLLFYQDKLSEEIIDNGEIIINKFYELEKEDREFYIKLEHLEYIIYNYLYYRFTKFKNYREKHLPYDCNLMVENVEKNYHISYTCNYQEAFVLFVKDKIDLEDGIEEDKIGDFLYKICKEWYGMENAKYQYYLAKEEEEKRNFIKKNKNYMEYIDKIREHI